MIGLQDVLRSASSQASSDGPELVELHQRAAGRRAGRVVGPPRVLGTALAQERHRPWCAAASRCAVRR